jgi:hypothetical protein
MYFFPIWDMMSLYISCLRTLLTKKCMKCHIAFFVQKRSSIVKNLDTEVLIVLQFAGASADASGGSEPKSSPACACGTAEDPTKSAVLDHASAVWSYHHVSAVWSYHHVSAVWSYHHVSAVWSYHHVSAVWSYHHVSAVWSYHHVSAVWSYHHVSAVWCHYHVSAVWSYHLARRSVN